MTAKFLAVLVAAITVGSAFSAGAGSVFTLPDGCKAHVTVQMRGCQVSHSYRCAADAPGDQWTVILDSGGAFFLSRIDAETRWLDSRDLETGERDVLLSEADPASFTTLLTTGRDDFDFRTESSYGEVRRYVGHDMLTGVRVTIDGVVLERTSFDVTAMDVAGTMIWHRQGQQFIHRDWRQFFSDSETFENAFGDRADVIDTPVDFALPGAPGFLSSEPQYDCDVLTASVTPGVMSGEVRP